MAYETLLLSREDGFAVITLNRPPANAISEELIRELNGALNELRDDAAVRAVIVTGAGERIFCGGADLGSAFSGGDVEAFIRFGNTVMRKMPGTSEMPSLTKPKMSPGTPSFLHDHIHDGRMR